MPKFIPRQRKHKVLARQNHPSLKSVEAGSSTNIEILPSVTQAEKEARRARLRAELRAQQPTVSGKKQKRLDKYIENKLKRDENLDYLKRLEKERERFDVGEKEGFISSKHLNSGGNKKRRFEEYVHGQVNADSNNDQSIPRNGSAGMEKTRGQQQTFTRDAGDQIGSRANPRDEYEDEDAQSEDSFEAENQDAFDDSKAPDTDASWLAKKAPAPQGTGLAKPLELDVDGLPIIPTRARKTRKPVVDDVSGSDEEILSDVIAEDELPWEGFDSENDDAESDDSDNDDESIDESDEHSSHDSTEESDTDTSTSEAPETAKIQIRQSAFKSWASQQLNQAIGHVPSYSANGEGELQPAPEKRQTSSEPAEQRKLVNGLPEVKTRTVDRNIYSVQVNRSQATQESRSLLPIIRREQEIMEAIHNHPVVVVKGDTGSGKTTQLPQFLYEAGYGDPNGPTPGLIGVTQPRRVAAVSMAKRVGEELGSHGNRVAHQIRFDSTVSSTTAIKFMTDGILLRELSQDLLLKKYSAIIIDEAHERSVNTDILIGMLSKIVPARTRKDKFNPDPKPLKLIIMSATLNIDDFLHGRLFSAGLRPPIVEAEGRQHRVTTHFALRSRSDYVEEVVEKVKRAHRKLPRGAILVFLTGQNEIRQVQNRLRKDLRSSEKNIADTAPPRMHAAGKDIPLEADDLHFGLDADRTLADEDEVDILTHSDEEAEEREFEISDDDDDGHIDEDDRNRALQTRPGASMTKHDPYDSVHVLPLYSQLPTKEQLRVFEPAPDRSRMIVLATNVAETSLTIPGIRFVFDCGRSKERKYNLETGVQSFEIDYISKASAQQRAGRAGRTGPGHCWRLYTSAIYEQFFPDHTEPEILRAPAESVVLQIKGFSYPRPVVDFPFPTAPTLQSLDQAEKLLKNLGALTSAGAVTDIGKQLSLYPLSPRLGKILATAISVTGLPVYAIAVAAGLAVAEIFVNDTVAIGRAVDEDESDDDRDQKRQDFGRAQATLSRHDKHSDVMKTLTAVSMYLAATDQDAFCQRYFLRSKAMSEVSQLVSQLRSIVQANHPGVKIPPLEDSKKMATALSKQIETMAAAGYIDQVAVRWDCAPSPPTLRSQPRRAIDVPYLPLIPLKVGSSADIVEKAVFIHPSSVLSRLPAKEVPQYIVYTHLQQAQTRTIDSAQIPKTRMFPLTPIDSASLGKLAAQTAMIEYGKPVAKTKIEELKGTPNRRICWVGTELRGGGAGSYGWNLPPTKVKQVMDVKSSSGWRVEEVLS